MKISALSLATKAKITHDTHIESINTKFIDRNMGNGTEESFQFLLKIFHYFGVENGRAKG